MERPSAPRRCLPSTSPASPPRSTPECAPVRTTGSRRSPRTPRRPCRSSGVTFEFWGVPADPSHDAQTPLPRQRHPRLRLRGLRRPQTLRLPAHRLHRPGGDLPRRHLLAGGRGLRLLPLPRQHLPGPQPDRQRRLRLGRPSIPTIEARPTTNVADAPSGLDVDLDVPQNDDDPDGIATAHLRDTTVTLPEGLTINPSGANGLDACSLAQFGYTSTDPDGTIHTTPDAATCPEAAKVATVAGRQPAARSPPQEAPPTSPPPTATPSTPSSPSTSPSTTPRPGSSSSWPAR